MAFLLALLPFLACAARFFFTCDDAFISFRYARHLAQGAGLTFNRGEIPPVEGFSNLLWVVWIAPWVRLGLDPAWIANATSVSAGIVLLALVARCASGSFGRAGAIEGGRGGANERQSSTFAALFFATLPVVGVWSTSGLETLPFALSVFGIFERLRAASPHAPRALGALVWCALASALRADGAAWAAVALAAAWIATPSAERARLLPALRACALTLIAVVIAIGIWRWSTYGELVPNTARVKAATSALRVERGARYVATLLLTLPGLLFAIAWALVRARERRVAVACAFVFGVTCAYSVWTGGDFMAMGRFFVPAAPFAAVALAAALVRETARVRVAGAGALLALSIGASFDLSPLPLGWRQALHFRWNEAQSKSEIDAWRGMRERAQEWRTLGRALALSTQPGESIVLGNIGAIGFESDLVIFDLFGLTDRDVARRIDVVRASPGHDKGVPLAYFLPRHPDYLGAWIATTPERDPGPADELALGGVLLELVRSGAAVVERHALPPARGFASHTELRVVRLRKRE